MYLRSDMLNRYLYCHRNAANILTTDKTNSRRESVTLFAYNNSIFYIDTQTRTDMIFICKSWHLKFCLLWHIVYVTVLNLICFIFLVQLFGNLIMVQNVCQNIPSCTHSTNNNRSLTNVNTLGTLYYAHVVLNRYYKMDWI